MASDRFAPDGAIWVCGACGKTHKDQYGLEGEGSRSWDESCALNAVLCHERKHVNSRGEIVWWAFSDPLPAYAIPTPILKGEGE